MNLEIYKKAFGECDALLIQWFRKSEADRVLIGALQKQNEILMEAVMSSYNIDTKYTDTSKVTYRDFYMDMMDNLEKALEKIKQMEKE